MAEEETKTEPKQTVQTRLYRPMPKEQIKQLPNSGQSYFEFGDICRRVIEATGNVYAWRVIKLEMAVNSGQTPYWICHGRLSIPGVGSRDGIGVHIPLGGAKNPQETEAPKAAETDAFKRAARMFGVGLELYDRDGAPSALAQGAATVARNGSTLPTQAAVVVWEGPGLCPRCHAPEGKKHSKPCTPA